MKSANKPLLIAATTLALSGAAFAQTATAPATDAPVVTAPATTPAESAADNAADAANSAMDAAGDAANAAGQAAGDAANAAGEAAGDAAAAANDAADAAADAAGEAADAAAAAPVAAPDVSAPALSATNPGVLGSWVTSRNIWTTNQPSSSAWSDTALTERPADWQEIAKVNDVVFDKDGQLVGYIADIGGFLGIGAKKVLLGTDAIHMVTINDDTFYATNFTKEELEALPDFDTATVMK
ncbi:MAG: hypothetical protein DI498_08955 [Paracoccus denitrificans]|nr:MAG: hypothetical protein DI498_08955 [Paracoccus denitrificans]PZO84185.1 MAG: hypothetical protein DI633_08955 [Paracoccus denitrificans]